MSGSIKRRDFLAGTAIGALVGVNRLSCAELLGNDDKKITIPVRPNRKFIHPGIFQTQENLEYMKSKILAGEEPWMSKWKQLKERPTASLLFQPHPVTCVFRGSFGKNKVGDDELHQSAEAAHIHAILWYVTGKLEHAQKSCEILDAWAHKLWSFDGNDAKLTAGWTGAKFCEAAEILRSTSSLWDIERNRRFTRFLLDVYLPIEQDLFSEANGNWDAAIMHTLAAISIFTEDSALFQRVVDHYHYGRGNGGLTKYIYPSGQCAESTRDAVHTQLGLGYFALTAHICWNQGEDLFSMAQNRLALGFEYTSRFLLGESVPCYGEISLERREQLLDFFEVPLEHYRFVKGIKMPYTQKIVEQARVQAYNTLFFYRGQTRNTPRILRSEPQVPTYLPSGAQIEADVQPPTNAIQVYPGEDLQHLIDDLPSGKVLFLRPGVHRIESSLRLPSGITLVGAGRRSILTFTPRGSGYAIVSAASDMHDVVLRDFVIYAGDIDLVDTDLNQRKRLYNLFTAPCRGGICFLGTQEQAIRNVFLERMTITDCTMCGVLLQGVDTASIIKCNISDNGADVIPGAGQHHNLRLDFCKNINVLDSRLDASMRGCGISARRVTSISINNCEVARNACSGIRLWSGRLSSVARCRLEGNEEQAIEQFSSDIQDAITTTDNIVQFNGASRGTSHY